jgi:hypothetical protein
MDHPPQRPGDSVNDELEVGYDERFETLWRRVELTSHALMLLFVLAALAGVFGRGPISHRTYRSPDGLFSVDFEPWSRNGTATQLTFHLPPSQGTSANPVPVRLFLGSAIVEPLGLQQVLPRPNRSEPADGGAFYIFDTASKAGDAMIRLVLKPSSVGPAHVEARLGDETLSWTQWVLP